jgi:hypothetical protein
VGPELVIGTPLIVTLIMSRYQLCFVDCGVQIAFREYILCINEQSHIEIISFLWLWGYFVMGGMTLRYYDNLGNEFLNKYKKILKIEKKL